MFFNFFSQYLTLTFYCHPVANAKIDLVTQSKPIGFEGKWPPLNEHYLG